MKAARLDEVFGKLGKLPELHPVYLDEVPSLVQARRTSRGAPVLVPVRTHLEDVARFNRGQELGFQLVDEVSRQCGIPAQDLLRPSP